MDGTDLKAGETYVTTDPVRACLYDMMTKDCVLADKVDLQDNTDLTFVEADEEDGFVFLDDDGVTFFCLHSNDLDAIETVQEA